LSLRRAINLLIYLSVILGLILLPQLYGIVPSWLFFSVLGGWVAYVIVAVLASKGKETAYPAALALSVIVLGASLPQPEHLAFLSEPRSLASITFTLGSITQTTLVVLILIRAFRSRKIHHH